MKTLKNLMQNNFFFPPRLDISNFQNAIFVSVSPIKKIKKLKRGKKKLKLNKQRRQYRKPKEKKIIQSSKPDVIITNKKLIKKKTKIKLQYTRSVS